MKPKLIKYIGKVERHGMKPLYGRAIYRCTMCLCEFETNKCDVELGKVKTCRSCGYIRQAETVRIRTPDEKLMRKVLWAMKDRCSNSKNPDYHNYGGRGVIVCDGWCGSLELFLSWCRESGYKRGLTIDRIDNNGDYEPGNCRWVTRFVQRHNQRPTKRIGDTGYIGVIKKGGLFCARVVHNRKRITVGCYKTEQWAALNRNLYIIENNLPNETNPCHAR